MVWEDMEDIEYKNKNFSKKKINKSIKKNSLVLLNKKPNIATKTSLIGNSGVLQTKNNINI